MSMNAKYNVDERKIANEVYQLVSQRTSCKRRTRVLNIRIKELKSKLNGKYATPRKFSNYLKTCGVCGNVFNTKCKNGRICHLCWKRQGVQFR